MASYWDRILDQRVSRRRTLAGVALTGAGALALSLVGCGSDDGGGDKSGLITEPKDTSKSAAKGGIWKSWISSDTRHFDPLSGGSSQIFFHSAHAYSRLLKYKMGDSEAQLTGEVEADAATSWEIQPDGLSVVLKLRPNMKFDPRPPTNGRPMDADDVVFSWNRFKTLSTSRGDMANEASPTAPVTSVEAVDKQTVKVNLKFPQAAILRMLAYFWYMPIMPREADGGFDPLKEMRGSGPWMQTKYGVDLGAEYRRNPNYYDADKYPLLDGIDYPLITENVQLLSQLKAKNVWGYGSTAGDQGAGMSQDQVLGVKNENPDLVMYPMNNLNSRGTTSQVINFSKRDNSPFKDVRIRQAASMVFDRDTFIDVFYNVSGFADAGIDVRYEWNSHVPASWGEKFWIDPRKNAKKLGEGAKNFEFNPEEAAKLLRAANAYGLQETFTYHGNRGGFGGVNYQKECEVMIDMLNKDGLFKLQPQILDYFTEITPKWTFSKGDFDGITPQPQASYPDMDLNLWAVYAPSGRNAYVGKPIPGVNELMEAHRRELDDDKRFDILYDIQRKLAVEMPAIPRAGIAEGFDLVWPWLGNYNAVQHWNSNSRASETWTRYWYDKSKETT
ncbi:MAG: ABC transporter substrate-binding protein [Dehalococcoidia bacterium]